MTAFIATPAQTITITSAQMIAFERTVDRALVAFFTGHARGQDGNGIGFAPAWDMLDTLAARGLVNVEPRVGCSPLVWLTSEALEIIEDIEAEGDFAAHVEAIRAAA
jgi:hypothetical protein